MSESFTICTCTEEPQNVTASSVLFGLPGVTVIGVGPASCLRHLYLVAMRRNAQKELRLCCITDREYALGRFRTKIRNALQQALEEDTASGILLYGTCADVLMQVDFEEIIAAVENPRKISIKIFRRGPLEKRKMPGEKRLRLLLQELREEMEPVSNQSEHGKSEAPFFLPPLASDFAGVYSMLHGWNCKLLLYSPGACATNLTKDERICKPLDFYYTRYNDIQAALGCEEQFAEALQALADKEPGQWIALVSTPVPYITGCDLERTTQAISDSGTLSAAFPCSGFQEYSQGIEASLLKLGQTLLSSKPKVGGKVLVLGYSPMEPVSCDQLLSAVALAREQGMTVSFWGKGELADLRRGADCSVCWVVSPAGEALARWMEETFAIPWFSDLPIGRSGMKRLFSTLADCTGIPLRNWPEEACTADERKVLIISEPLTGICIQRCISEDFGLRNSAVDVYGSEYLVSRFDRDIFGQPIVYFKDAEKIKEQMAEADILIADPMFEELAQSWDFHPRFISVPHPALSGRLYSNSPAALTAEAGYQYFSSRLCSEERKKENEKNSN